MKYVSIDLETTGLDPDTQHILEFGAVVDDLLDPKPLEDLPRLHCYFNDFLFDTKFVGDEFALDLNKEIIAHITSSVVRSDLRPLQYQEFAKHFSTFLLSNGFSAKKEKGYIHAVAAGKNFSSFDKRFIDKRLGLSGDVRFHHRVLDPTSLYVELGEDDVPPDMSTCLKRAGLDTNVRHTAIEDSLDVISLLRHKLLGSK